MILKNITLENFRQYKGIQTINFSMDPNKNVTIITTDNTGGKTTIRQAILWALYGKTYFKLDNKFLFNKEEAREMRAGDVGLARVEIRLIHNNIEYIIEKSQKYVSKISGSAVPGESYSPIIWNIINDDKHRVSDPANHVIDRILPEELSPYFFFDGENMGSIFSNSRINLKNSVSVVMGLKPLENMKNHMLKVKDTFRKRLVGSDNGDASINKFRIMEEEVNRKIESFSDLFERTQLEKKAYEDDYYGALKQMEIYEDRINMAKELRVLEEKSKGKIVALKQSTIRTCSTFNKDYFSIFSSPLIFDSIKNLKDTDVKDKGIPEMNSKSIDFIINRGHCICGREINKEMKDKLREEMLYLPPESIGMTLRTFNNKLSQLKDNASRSIDKFSGDYSTVLQYMDDVEDDSRNISHISSKLKDIPELQDITSRFERAKKDLDSCSKRIYNVERDLKAARAELKEIDDNIEKNAKVIEKNKLPLLYMEYAAELGERAGNIHSVKEQKIHKSINDKVKIYFDKMYHGSREICVDKDYNIITKVMGTKSDTSGGLEVVIDFSFAAALLDLAKEMVKDEETPSEPYPLLLDAPFSNADEDHMKNISKAIPSVSEQVILMSMYKDWNIVKDDFKDKIGKEYRIVKVTEEHSFIEEV